MEPRSPLAELHRIRKRSSQSLGLPRSDQLHIQVLLDLLACDPEEIDRSQDFRGDVEIRPMQAGFTDSNLACEPPFLFSHTRRQPRSKGPASAWFHILLIPITK